MTNNPEGKLGQRTVKNSFTKRMIENTCNTEENTKNISEMNNQNTMQIPVQNYQETQRNLNEENNNLKPVPVANSNNQMLAPPVQMQPQPIPNVISNNSQNINQMQVQTTPIVTNQTVVPNQIIYHHIAVAPSIMSVKTYMPFNMTCPYCAVEVTTVPETDFNCGFCCLITFFSIWFTPLTLCIHCCVNGDFCCYDAMHKCPICGRCIARKTLK